MSTNLTVKQKANIANRHWSGASVKVLCRNYFVLGSALYTWLKPYQNVYASKHAITISFLMAMSIPS